ncbi:thymidylate synthase [Aeromonas phage AerS_266]|nr:thymidylate synthase [Aeromonas phage AerS_266]
MNDQQHLGEMTMQENDLLGIQYNWAEKAINSWELWYAKLLTELVNVTNGKEDRTGTGVNSISHVSYTHDLRESFPLVRGRFLKPENPGKEMTWMLGGSSNEKDLAKLGVPFWSEFADATGELGPVYGYLWRHWPNPDGTETDQIAYVENLLKHNPTSRRILVNCWHPSFIPDSKTPPKENYKVGKQALTPCHFAWTVTCQPMSFTDRLEWVNKQDFDLIAQIYSIMEKFGGGPETVKYMDEQNVPKFFSDLQFFMRSSDTVLGLPANFNMYGHLAHFIAKSHNFVARNLTYSGSDVHLYHNHFNGVEKYLGYLQDHPEVFNDVGQFELNVKRDSIVEYQPEDFVYINYSKEQVGPAIKFPVAV